MGNQTLDPAYREGDRGDVPDYAPTPEDIRPQEVYRGWVHANPGTHLNGEFGDDKMW